MIYFVDDFKYTVDVRFNSKQNVVEIRHTLDEDEDNETDHNVYITGANQPEYFTGEIWLMGDGKTLLSDIANEAQLELNFNGDKPITPLESIRNYKSYLLGERAGWTLRKIQVWPSGTRLRYINELDEEEEIYFDECPFDLMFEISYEEDDEGATETFFAKLARRRHERDDAAHGITSSTKQKKGSTEQIIIRYNRAEGRTEIWAGEINKGIDNGLQPGQRMLSIEYNNNDDIVITRYYHTQDFSDEFMEQALQRDSFHQTFCL